MLRVRSISLCAGLTLACLSTLSGARAEDKPAAWQVARTSGDVWVVTTGAQNASLTTETALKPGDSVRTGRSGRVLLRRGQETIMVSPNSVVGIPESSKPESTTIIQQSGSILLEVNKRDARTFEVETPYLVAAVKGTQFRVTVGPKGADVKVQHGSVEVADVKTGKFALVMPGQSAIVSTGLKGGLSLQGTGTLNPIQNGTPRPGAVGRIPVPRGGLTAPGSLRAGQQVRSLASAAAVRAPAAGNSGLRIAAPIGQVRLDINAATRGLASDASPSTAATRRGSSSSASSDGGTASPSGNASNAASSNGAAASGSAANVGAGITSIFAASNPVRPAAGPNGDPRDDRGRGQGAGRGNGPNGPGAVANGGTGRRGNGGSGGPAGQGPGGRGHEGPGVPGKGGPGNGGPGNGNGGPSGGPGGPGNGGPGGHGHEGPGGPGKGGPGNGNGGPGNGGPGGPAGGPGAGPAGPGNGGPGGAGPAGPGGPGGPGKGRN